MTKKINNVFKVNLDNKDILVTEEQRMEFLQLHNKLRDAIRYMEECKDIHLSDVSMLERLQHALHTSLKFSPQKDKDGGGSCWYRDWVLSSDETAYEYEQ